MVSPNLTGSRKNTPKRNLFIAVILRFIGEDPAPQKCWTGFLRCLRWHIFEIRSFPKPCGSSKRLWIERLWAEEVYQGMSGILFKAQLMPEAEAADGPRSHAVSGIQGRSVLSGPTLPQQCESQESTRCV